MITIREEELTSCNLSGVSTFAYRGKRAVKAVILGSAVEESDSSAWRSVKASRRFAVDDVVGTWAGGEETAETKRKIREVTDEK